MKKAIYTNYRWIFALLLGLAIPAFELTSDSKLGSANVSPELTQMDNAEVSQPSQTFIVTGTADGTGAGTFRTAIISANANPGTDTIAFNIAGAGVQTITLTSSLPAINDPVIIDASTQPLYAGTPLIRLAASGSGVTSVINITGGNSTVRALTFNFFSGVTAGNGVINLASNGNVVVACAGGIANTQVVINGGANNRIGGLIPADRNYYFGITSGNEIVIVKGAAATGNRIVGNWFGTTQAGVRTTNAGKNILIDNAPNNFIGGSAGTTPGGACTGECNLISGSDDEGIFISGTTATGNSVIGNFIGLAADGSTANRNGSVGIHINNAVNNHIGGTTPAERNVIAANFFGGIFVEGTSTGTTITGNYVGLKSNGTEAVTGTFNVPGFGIELNSSNVRVGGVTAGERNIISGSNRGLIINGGSNQVQGNFIGTDVTGSVALTTLFDGVVVNGANNTIGGTAGTTLGGACTGACNLISGNGRNGFNHGLVISGTGATGNVIDGNYIGLNAAGTAAIRNGTPPNGNAVLIFNANNNTIGRTITGSRPESKNTKERLDNYARLLPVYCVQDNITGDYIKFDAATGEFTAKNCKSGGIRSSPPNGEVHVDQQGSSIVTNGLSAIVLTSGLGTGIFFSSDGIETRKSRIHDSDVNNNVSCSCPPFDEQTIEGPVEIAGDTGSNNNLISYNLSGTSANGLTNLSLPTDTNIQISNGNGNNVKQGDLTSQGQSNILINAGTGNTITDNIYEQNYGVQPISGGNSGTWVVQLTDEPDNAVRLTGSLSTGIPNQRYQYDLNGVDLVLSNGLERTRVYDLGIGFEVTTGTKGTVSINHLFTGVQSLAINQSHYVRAVATTVDANNLLGQTTEMSPLFTVPQHVLDFGNDGKTDIAVFRPGATSNAFSYWYVLSSQDNTVESEQFGSGEDQIVPGDWNGDQRTDYAVFRPSNSTWYHTNINGDPSTSFVAIPWGQTGDIPVKGDFDGDGVFDPTIYRNGTWWILQSLTNGPLAQQFGLATDKPVPADYNGDGRTDIAVYRNGTWYISICPTCGVQYANFGLSTDKPVPMDYDGDGKADVAVFRPSNATWYILQSSNQQVVYSPFGLSTDIPVPGDYDADGKVDVGVWRPSDGNWYMTLSGTGEFKAVHFGQSGDVPIPAK